MAEKLFKEKFEIIHFLDSIRWQKTGNYYLINFAYPNNVDKGELTDDEKLLTHWLLYVTDRQMPFQQIWDKGGLIFSEIVHEFKKNGSINHLTDLENGTFKIAKDGYDFVSKISYSNLCDEQKKRLSRYYSNEEIQNAQQNGMLIKFKSRYYTDDYLCILYTLYALSDEKFGGSFTKYLSTIIEKIYTNANIKDDEKIKYCVFGMAYALHRLTYDIKYSYNGKRITYKKTSAKNLNIEDFIKGNEFNVFLEEHKRIVKGIVDLNDRALFETLKNFFDLDKPNKKNKNKFINMKRVWCSLRDYLKSPAYKNCFKKCLEGHLKEIVDNAFLDDLFSDDNNSSNACQWLELPGDVWNENSVFRRCITVQTDGKLGEVLRNEYNNLKQNDRCGYPEEFDTTFDFVPRMCEKNNCDICPFGAIQGQKIDKDKIYKLCVARLGKYCPLVLLYCGYYYECCNSEDKCTLKKYLDYNNN